MLGVSITSCPAPGFGDAILEVELKAAGIAGIGNLERAAAIRIDRRARGQGHPA